MKAKNIKTNPNNSNPAEIINFPFTALVANITIIEIVADDMKYIPNTANVFFNVLFMFDYFAKLYKKFSLTNGL